MHRKEFPIAIHWAMILGLLILVMMSDIGNEAHSKSQTFINVTMKYNNRCPSCSYYIYTTRVTDYGHRIRAVYGRIWLKYGVFTVVNSQIRAVYGRIWLKYGVFTVVNGQIRAVYMPYFTVIQVDVLRPYSYRIVYGVFTAKIRQPYMAVFSSYTAVLSPYYHRL
jgi:hypothetical protein